MTGAAPTSLTAECIYSKSQWLATIEGGATKYHHADHLSVRVPADSNGNVIGRGATIRLACRGARDATSGAFS